MRVERSTLGAVWRAIDRARRVRAHLRDRPILARETSATNADDAVRWLGPLNVGGRLRQALFCHPDAAAVFRTTVPTGATVRAYCALVPEVWKRNGGGVTFEIVVSRRESGRSARAERTIRPRLRRDHRLWRPLRVRVPAPAGPQDDVVIVRLATRIPPGAGSEYAWAVWGDPLVEWPQPAARLVTAARALLNRLRADGAAETLRYLRGASPSVDDAALFAEWVRLHTPSPEDLARLADEARALAWRPTISLITPVYNTDPRWLRACIESVRGQVYPDWELCLCDDASGSAGTRAVLQEYAGDSRVRLHRLERNQGIAAASNAALALASGDFVALLDHDDELTPDALFQVARRLNERRDADILYSDEDKIDEQGRRSEPHFKPDWAPEQLLSYMYACHLLVARRSLVLDAGGFRTECAGAQDYDLLLRLAERTTRIEHVDRILYHWRKVPGSTAGVTSAKPWAVDAGRRALEDAVVRRGWDAEVLPGAGPGIYRVRRRIRGAPLVSVVMPTRGGGTGARPDVVERCVRSLGRTTYRDFEVIVAADEGRVSGALREALASLPHRIVPYRGPASFNFSHKVNTAAAHASGDHLVLLNDDVEVVDGAWMEAMLEFSQDPEIGAVGAKLYYPDGRLQHVGMLLGVAGIAAHAFHQHPGSAPGYFGSNLLVRNASAVTAACMMTRRAVYLEAGGLDESLPIDFNDVDYCLRLRSAGYRIVFTPYAQLYHHESASFGPRTQDPERMAEMRRRWGAAVERDPYYNRHLSVEFPDYRLRLQ